MKNIMILMIASISLLLQSCGLSDDDIKATAKAEIFQTQTQQAEQAAVAATQTAIEAEKTALAMTQTAMAITPTIAPTEVLPTVPPVQVGAGTSCPFYVYQDWGADVNHFVPEGWMGDTSDIKLDENYKLDPERPNVIQIAYEPNGPLQWSGVYWWDPPGSFFGDQDGGFDLSCAKKLTLWARGEKGGEKAEFKVGGLKGKYSDSLQPAKSSGPIILTNKWVQYTIDLTGKDLSHIIGGFIWVTNKQSNQYGAVIYIDDIKFEQ
jgi:hypothetical protein